MKRKQILKCALIMALPILGGNMITSCIDDFESINTSNVQVDPNDLPTSAQWLEPMTYCYPPQQNMFQFWTNLTIDLYSGYFMTPNGGFTNGDLGENRGHSGGMHENFYLHIFNNTRRIIAACKADGENGLAAVMSIVQAYGTLMTTDAYGPLAYTSILEADEYTTSYYFDSQQQLYKIMLTDLGEAITAIESMTETEKAKLKSADVWCNGDTEMWVKIANTMRLRMALRLSKRVDEMNQVGIDVKQIATDAAKNTLANGGKDILIEKGLENYMWLMFNWGDCGFNANLVTLMSGMKDPRQPLYMTKNIEDVLYEGYSKKKDEDGVVTYWKGDKQVDKSEAVAVEENKQYLGIRFASGLPNKPNNWASFSSWVDYKNEIGIFTAPLPIFKQAESYFLLAEAKLRWNIGNESVQQLYEDGIRKSMENELKYRGNYAGIKQYADNAVEDYIVGTSTQIDYNDPIRPELSVEALNKLGVKWDEGATQEEKLERIITQKYFALFPLSTEAWAEQRRTGYPRLFPAFVNESNGAIDSTEGIRRVIYAENEYNTNAAELEKSGIKLLNDENTSKLGFSGDKGGTHVWWDNANKGNF